ncbi:hypothetical protein BGW42_004295 [Actinomortierella wolfii]|nr:hypothetical protein BGW42_004295 [Actinomortierella wolfii]
MLPRNVLAIRSRVGSTTEVICRVTTKTGHSFLLEYPPGAYTGMRTIDQKGVLDFSGHVTRLANSLQQIHFHDPSYSHKNQNQHQNQDQSNGHRYEGKEPPSVQQGLAPFRNVETLMQEAQQLVRAGLSHYYQVLHQQEHQLQPPHTPPPEPLNLPSLDQDKHHHQQQQLLNGCGHKLASTTRSIMDETKITLLCTWDFKTESPAFLAHFEPLKVPMTKRCKVEIHGSPRDHATTKDSQWVRDREAIEKTLEPGTNEALLMDDKENIYEGLSSNFFAVVDGSNGQGPTVITAPLEYVLQGTIHRAVQAICKKDNIPLEYRFPNLKEIDQWRGAFVSSTSRLVLPIETVVLPDGTHKHIPDSPLVEQLRAAVAEECKRRVEVLLD